MDKNEIKDKNLPPYIVVSDDVKEIYVNSSSIAAGIYDFLIDFGLAYPDGHISTLVRLRMSPQHAWVLAQILTRTVSEYIEKAGAFEFPEEFLKEKNLFDEYNEQIKKRLHKNG